MKAENTVVGILAHVDAGKTTLAERMLYESGAIASVGRVDHGNTFLDNDAQERARGITIFSKQAQLSWKDKKFTLLDTPGHTDFSAEMERAVWAMDYAILVISGTDGIQGHVYTLWKLLKRHKIPVFLFINKMDLAEGKKQDLLCELKKQFGEGIVDFTEPSGMEFMENIAVCEEAVLEAFLENGVLEQEQIKQLIADRKVFPCFFGSALKGEGVQEFMAGLSDYMISLAYPQEFGAKVFKISRDEQGNRLTHLKITGGSLKVKALVGTQNPEKVNQIRIYSGTGYEAVPTVCAGQVCAVTGLTQTYSGQALGVEKEAELPILEPVLNYQVLLMQAYDVHQSFLKLRQLEEEDPALHIVWNKEKEEIHIQLMGEVQIEVLKTLIKERFDMEVAFGAGSIVYKERIASKAEGVGHYEPLRHYSEVHLILEPAEPGSGMTYETRCSEDILDRNWQRLILTHLEERTHKGVLTGSELTDTKITLVSGKAHIKHTEGGDFRQSTYRAVRHGLMYAESELLEPVYRFRLTLPTENLGRAMNDIQRMYGRFETPDTQGGYAVLTGIVPVASMQGYQIEVAAYTRGLGRLMCEPFGYEPCHNAQEVIEQIGYEPESDLENTADSVFCSHGAGFVVPWNEVYDYMHLELSDKTQQSEQDVVMGQQSVHSFKPRLEQKTHVQDFIAQDEIEEIFQRTFGTSARRKKGWEGSKRKEPTVYMGQNPIYKPQPKADAAEYLLVDGYNIIFAWEELKELAKENVHAARDRLADILCNYQGYKKCHVILVFDAYRVKEHVETIQPYHNIHIVYTKEAESADSYIARTASKMEGQYKVTVATSDALVQMIIWGKGAVRISAQGLWNEIQSFTEERKAQFLGKQKENRLENTVLPMDIKLPFGEK